MAAAAAIIISAIASLAVGGAQIGMSVAAKRDLERAKAEDKKAYEEERRWALREKALTRATATEATAYQRQQNEKADRNAMLAQRANFLMSLVNQDQALKSRLLSIRQQGRV